jgi:hypothetical protein
MAAADRGAALELKRCPKEQPSVEEPVLVCIGRRCDLHHKRCTTRRSDCNIRHRHARSGHAACGILTCSTRRGARGVRRTAREMQPATTHAMKQRNAYSNVNHASHNTSLAHDDTQHEPCRVQQCQACSRRHYTKCAPEIRDPNLVWQRNTHHAPCIPYGHSIQSAHAPKAYQQR